MKKIGFLSFGHWSPDRGSATRSAQDTLLQSIDLAIAAEELGADGAYFRVHHFARQLGSPFPLLAAVGMQARDWGGVPPESLFRIVGALRAVGLGGEARMIAAEAIARA